MCFDWAVYRSSIGPCIYDDVMWQMGWTEEVVDSKKGHERRRSEGLVGCWLLLSRGVPGRRYNMYHLFGARLCEGYTLFIYIYIISGWVVVSKIWLPQSVDFCNDDARVRRLLLLLAYNVISWPVWYCCYIPSH